MAAPTATGTKVKAKSVIFVWLWGAPSHLDTFDPKPNAPAEYRGAFSTIATKTPGLRFTELLPRLASRSDRFSLVRSNVTSDGAHPTAGTIGLCGFAEGAGPEQPSFGAIVGRHRGQTALPSFVTVGRGVPRDVVRPVKGFGGGFWGGAYDPFQVECLIDGKVNIPALQLLDGLSPERLDDRRLLARELDDVRRHAEGKAVDAWRRTYQSALGLLTAPEAREALDMSRESPTARERYGRTTFGQSCLLARRMVEAGVPFVQVNWSQYVEAMTPNCDFGWDTHIYNFELLNDWHGPVFDRAFSALLDDLRERGLSESTLVVAIGEFGRSPKITNKASRDHWQRCYFSLWAGGGVRPGRVVGASDKLGEDPVTEPISPLMVGTTIAELAGLGAQERAQLRVLDGGRVIHDLV